MAEITRLEYFAGLAMQAHIAAQYEAARHHKHGVPYCPVATAVEAWRTAREMEDKLNGAASAGSNAPIDSTDKHPA